MFGESLIRKVRRLCEEAYPDEACGLVVGPRHTGDGGSASGGGMYRVVRCSNIQDRLHEGSPGEYPETAREAYAMDPDELRQIADEMEARDEAVRAIYHSHTDFAASFSRRDADRAALSLDRQSPRTRDSGGMDGAGGGSAKGREPVYRGALYLVVEVRGGRAAGLKWFRWDDVEGDFLETAVPG